MSATPSSSTTSQTQPSTPTGSNPSSFDGSSSGISGYYFVFFALILCILAFAGFTVIRRRKRLAYSANRRADDWAYPSGRTRTTRDQAWLGRWRSAEQSREEGLNEHGEAPPPYVPKSSEELRNNTASSDGHTMATQEPAIPLQTLSRQDVGLKPPDYEERELTTTTTAATRGESSRSEPGSSRHPS